MDNEKKKRSSLHGAENVNIVTAVVGEKGSELLRSLITEALIDISSIQSPCHDIVARRQVDISTDVHQLRHDDALEIGCVKICFSLPLVYL